MWSRGGDALPAPVFNLGRSVATVFSFEQTETPGVLESEHGEPRGAPERGSDVPHWLHGFIQYIVVAGAIGLSSLALL